MKGLNELEEAVMEMLLAGENPILEGLREQFANAKFEDRELTGVGFFCYFRVPDHAKRLSAETNFVLNDVNAEIPGLKNGAGFLLFIRNGCIQALEGYTVEEDWPETIEGFELHYHSFPREFEIPT